MQWPLLAICIALFATRAAAQEPARGRIVGVVRDTTGRPVPQASILAMPGERRARTDSSGVFSFHDLGPGRYEIRIRRIGFLPHDEIVSLPAAVPDTLRVVLIPRVHELGPVVVRAQRQCSAVRFEGALCRMADGKGLIMTEEEIAEKQPLYVDDVFWEVPGFRMTTVRVAETRRSANSEYVVANFRREAVSVRGWRCIRRIVNGHQVSLANPMPEPSQLRAVEVYQPSEVPPEYRQWASPPVAARVPSRGARCTVVNYWSKDAP